MTTLRVTILGSGTSHGIPMIACDCEVCTSADPRDKRTRTSALLEINDRAILIDTAPELRIQCLANDVRRVDAVLYTHAHADHVVGLDDLRRFNSIIGTLLTCYGNRATVDVLNQMFAYAFDDDPDYPSTKPQLELATIDGPFDLFGLRVEPIPLWHGQQLILGFRFGPFAYCTDCSEVPEESMPLLNGLDVLVLDGLRRRPHPTHFNITQAVEVARQIGAKQTYFTHIAHELAHAETNAELPDNMELAYDGLTFELPVPNRQRPET